MSNILLVPVIAATATPDPAALRGRWVPVPAGRGVDTWVRTALHTPARARGAAPEPLFGEAEVGDEPTMRIPVGLLPAVRLVERMATGIGFTTCPAGATPTRSANGLSHFVETRSQGLIRYHPGRVDPPQLVLRIVRQLPGAVITVLVSRQADAVSLARFLRRHGVDAYAYLGSGTPYLGDRPLEARVAVATVAGLAGNPTELEKQDLIVCLDAVAAAGRVPREVLMNYTLPTTRLFGLVPLDDRPAGADEDWVHALFGFESHDVLIAGLKTRRVEVTTVAAGGRRLARAAASDLELRRHGVWRNESRNRQVARVARAVAALDAQALRKPGIGVTHLPGAGRVVVLAENLEHALYLLPKLEGWALAVGPHFHAAGLGDEERGLLAERLQIDPAVAPGVVATPAGLEVAAEYISGAKPIAGWAAVVRADAGDGLPPVPEDELVGGIHPLQVIDLTDDHHPALEVLAAGRRRTYVAAGWSVDGVDPAWARATEFVRRRAHLLHLREVGGK